jgi:membrane associated rhomboid family serine protease
MNAMVPPEDIPDQPQPFLRLPVGVGILAALLIALYAALSFAPPALYEYVLVNYAFIPARYSPAFLAAHNADAGSLIGRALPFVTYIFLHGSWMHVIVNTVWLLAFGPVVSRRFGVLRFLAFFILCGIAGAAIQLACSWGSTDPIIGASAAISGLMGAAFRLLGRDGGGVFRPQPLAPIFSRQILTISLVWVVINVIAGVTGLGTGGTGVQLIAWQAHLGGYAAGLLLAGLFDPLSRLKPGEV